MNDHPIVTTDPDENARLVHEYDTVADTSDAFTTRIRSLGYAPPERADVTKWALCVIGDDDGNEWLVWDAVAVDRTDSL